MNSKRLLRIASITAILMFSFFGGLYILGMRSDGYKFALRYIDDNPTVVNNIGPIKNRCLSFWGGYTLRYSGPHGYAEYKIFITGERGKGAVYLNLEKNAGIWEIKKGNLVLESGVSIPLPLAR